MCATRTAAGERSIYRIFPGSTELSPFHRCYETEDTVLRVCAGRFFVHDNGDDPVAAYWALREKAVLYDVPERPLEISGPDASRFLEMIFARRISDLRVGRGRYAIACAFGGGIFMDGILFRLAPDRFWFVQPDGDMRTWLLAHDNGLDVRVSDPRSRVLQVQGPRSFDVMRDASGGAIDGSLRYFGSGFFEVGGQEVHVSRTGWTGELGYEIYTLGDRTDCPRLWDHLMASGAAHGLIFSSMRSMNIRRIEAGILDCGSDFDTSMNPFEAGLGKFVDLEKEGFVGREALLTAGRSKRLYGLLCRDLVPSGGFGVFDGDDRVGVVTTGARSPYLEAGIGYVRFDNGGNWAGRTLSMRSGTHGDAACEIVDPPFHDRGKEIPRARIRDAK